MEKSRLTTLREKKGWSQTGLAKRAGVSRMTINKIEKHGYRKLNSNTIEKLSKALGSKKIL